RPQTVVTAQSPAALSGSLAERPDDEPGRRATGVLLLTGHEVAVAPGVRLETAVHNEVGVLQLLGLVLDPKRLDPATDELISVLILRILETGPRPAVHQQAPRGQLGSEQNRGGMTDHAGHPAGLIKVG